MAQAKNKEKWKPKRRWIESFTINLDKPEKVKYKYYIPKDAEEEKKMEDEFNQKMDTIFDILFPEGIYKVMEKFRKNKALDDLYPKRARFSP